MAYPCRSVLIADDYQDSADLYAAYLEGQGLTVSLARDGVEAVELARRQLPDVIVLDLGLPRMDGWEAAACLRADERTCQIPIIALSGHTLPEDINRARVAGCDSVLSKPCLPEELLAEIQRVSALRSIQ